MLRHWLSAYLLYSFSVQAEVRVAFLTATDSKGKPVQLEKDGRFSHVAIWVEGKWLHSYINRPVEWVETLEDYGMIGEVLVDPKASPITFEQIKKLLELPYDPSYAWNNSQSTYCAKLVGLLLGVKPLPMSFSSERWKDTELLPVGELGLSPDDIYDALVNRGYRSNMGSLCKRVLLY